MCLALNTLCYPYVVLLRKCTVHHAYTSNHLCLRARQGSHFPYHDAERHLEVSLTLTCRFHYTVSVSWPFRVVVAAAVVVVAAAVVLGAAEDDVVAPAAVTPAAAPAPASAPGCLACSLR